LLAGQRPGDVVLTPGGPGTDVALAYYGERRLRPIPPYIAGTDRVSVATAFKGRHRAWIIQALPARTYAVAGLRRVVALALQPYRYRPLEVRLFQSTVPLVLVLAAPR